jgi:predicted RNase H-like nuclease (RuvC/YqgF family)
VVEEYVEREVVVPGDSIKVSLPILIQDNKPVPQKVTARSSRASVQLEITPLGTATAQANCDEYLAKINVLERSVNTYRHDIEVYKEKESRLQKTINDIYRWIKRGVIAVAILIALIATLKYLKPILLIIKNLVKWQKNSI